MLTVLSLGAALGYGVSDFAGGLAARRIHPLRALLYGQPAGLAVIVGLAFLFPGHLSAQDLCLSGLAGLAGLGGLALMYRLMAAEPLSIVAPTTAVLAAATPLFAGILGGEHPDPSAWIGIGVGLAAVVMITHERDGRGVRRVHRRIVLLAVAAGTGFGAYFVLIAHTGHEAGVLPLLVTRLTAVVALGVFLRRRSAVTAPRRGNGAAVTAAVVAGLVEAAADTSFLLASRDGYVSLAGVITAFYPAVTVLLALIVLRERRGRMPSAGLGLALVSLGLLAR